MHHGDQLTAIAIIMTVAMLCGLLLGRQRQPAMIGYIIAGVVLGPSGFGFLEDREQILLLAELGVLLLLFTIGLEIDASNFRSILRFAFAATGMQIAIATAVFLLVAIPMGWNWQTGVLVGFGVALSSTAVTIKVLEELGAVQSEIGQRIIAILIAQDLAVVPMMLFVSTLAADQTDLLQTLAPALGSVLFLAFVLWFLARQGRIKLPFIHLIHGKSDLIAIGALAVCFAAASISGLLGLSTAYGAFLAGLFLGNSTDRSRIETATLPIQGVLLMVFFLSIGLLIDLAFVWDHIVEILVMLLLVTLGKTAMNVGILKFLGEPWPRAWFGGVALGQVGEFSFLLIALGLSVNAIDNDAYREFLTVIAFSLIISPIWLDSARRLQRVAESRTDTLRDLMTRLYPLLTRQTGILQQTFRKRRKSGRDANRTKQGSELSGPVKRESLEEE